MARHAEILERRQRADRTYLFCRLYMEALDSDGNPTTIELGEVEVADGTPIEVKSRLVTEAQRLQQLPVGKVIDL